MRINSVKAKMQEARHPKGTLPSQALFGHITADKLEAFCSSPLSFVLRSAMRLQQSLRREPHH